MEFPGYALRTADEHLDDIRRAAEDASQRVWPEFLRHGAVGRLHWAQLWTRFPEYQYALVHDETGHIVAIGHSIPLAWRGPLQDLPPEGWEWAIADGMRPSGRPRDTLSALAIIVLPDHQRKGLGRLMVQAMCDIGRRHGLGRLVVPLRPTLKSRYPLTPMDRYVGWRNEDGLPFDPWLRLHVRAGGSVRGVCPRAYTVEGTVDEWEEWTGMRLPESGEYTVPGALAPIEVDADADSVRYVEANVWVAHEVRGPR